MTKILTTLKTSKLSGILYVLDEPSIGLHPKNSDRLIKILKDLRDLKNTVLVVEHDEAFINAADYVFDLGPGAGDKGGKIVPQGIPLIDFFLQVGNLAHQALGFI